MEINYWITNSDSFMHQIFMIVMGGLYALAFIAGVSYKAMNIYCYFVFYPASFALFMKSRVKYIIVLMSALFFAVPGFEAISSLFFDRCVVFLNQSADKFNSNYIEMSIYLCVVVPLLLYIPFFLYRFGWRNSLKGFGIFALVVGVYLLTVYPLFHGLLVSVADVFQ